ncbi:MAG: YkgJ family cysteine cluster protein [Candidatus Brocadiia bacterium]
MMASARLPEAAFRELAALYERLDTHLASLGVVCRQCGECCHFARHDYRLYASRLERDYLAFRHGVPRLGPDGACGYLAGGLCSAHPRRPLGCRIFFCHPAHEAREGELYHAWQRRLRAIVERFAIPWDYAPFFPD